MGWMKYRTACEDAIRTSEQARDYLFGRMTWDRSNLVFSVSPASRYQHVIIDNPLSNLRYSIRTLDSSQNPPSTS